MTFVKVCGLKDEASLDAALDAGADALGFVLFVPKSPRNIEPADFQRLAQRVGGRARTVVVTANVAQRQLDEVVRALKPDVIQLHGRQTSDELRSLREAQSGPGQEVWKAVAIDGRETLARVADTEADRILLDAKPPDGATREGGHGAAFDWSILDGWEAPKPWILAGGLTPDNVAEAIEVTRATAVDVSSGVESAPGVKDLTKIRAFIRAAKAAKPKGAVA